MSAPDQEAVEGHREGPRVEAPQGPLEQVVVGGKVHRGGVGLLGEHYGRVYQCEKDAPRGGGRGGLGRRRRGRWAKPTDIVIFL